MFQRSSHCMTDGCGALLGEQKYCPMAHFARNQAPLCARIARAIGRPSSHNGANGSWTSRATCRHGSQPTDCTPCTNEAPRRSRRGCPAHPPKLQAHPNVHQKQHRRGIKRCCKWHRMLRYALPRPNFWPTRRNAWVWARSWSSRMASTRNRSPATHRPPQHRETACCFWAQLAHTRDPISL